MYDLYKAALLKIKNNSLPSLGKGWFKKKFFPAIVDKEMFLRRTPLEAKRAMATVATLVAMFVFILSLLFALKHQTDLYRNENAPQNQSNPALPHKAYDQNTTLKYQLLHKVR